ncbi:hypothetical protein J23TS9_46390 [Paenibacillus sp. J23TS9]|nr:hypothetical protein J23TS9_46390 [Paenibacillus sp. J23TS9]
MLLLERRERDTLPPVGTAMRILPMLMLRRPLFEASHPFAKKLPAANRGGSFMLYFERRERDTLPSVGTAMLFLPMPMLRRTLS